MFLVNLDLKRRGKHKKLLIFLSINIKVINRRLKLLLFANIGVIKITIALLDIRSETGAQDIDIKIKNIVRLNEKKNKIINYIYF